MKDLNLAQKQAIEYNEGPLLIVAGAGTGKTTVITNKITYLINEKKVSPEEILAITFTDKATAEMQDRVSEMMPVGGFDVFVSTFHGLAQRILENHGLDIGLPNNFRLINETESWLLVRENLDKFDLEYYRPLGNPTKFIHDLTKHFGRCKDELITPTDYLSYAEKIDTNTTNTEETTEVLELNKKKAIELARAYAVYNQILLDRGVFDFSDLIYYAVKLLRERPNVQKFYQNQYKYILVDEFQDTNWSQYELIKLLFGKNTKLTVVGDDDQSIYKFRGASVANILQFKDDFPEAKEIVLTENFRSQQAILDAAYNFIQNNNPDRLETKLKLNKKLISNSGAGGTTDLIYSESAAGEAEALIEKILEIKKTNPKSDWSEFAILCRANNTAEQFVPVLIKHGIPYDFTGAVGLFRQKVVLDCFAYLKIIDNYHESTAVYRLLSCPIFNFSGEDLSVIATYVHREVLSWYEAVKLAAEGAVSITDAGRSEAIKFIELVKIGTEIAKTENVAGTLYKFLEKSNYLKWLSDNAEKKYREIFYLQGLFDEMNRFVENYPDASTSAWLKYFSFVLDTGSEGELPLELQQSEINAVKIMTVHKSKGLEFDWVFIPGMVAERFPSTNRHDSIELPNALLRESEVPSIENHLQEERRLLYVAITRACKGVFFTAAKNYGGARDKKLSRFIEELDQNNNFGWKNVAPERRSNLAANLSPEIHEETSMVYSPPKELSFSQLAAFQKCPWQYRFQFILKLPTPGKGVFNFGKTIHDTLYKFYSHLMELNPLDENQKCKPDLNIPTEEILLNFYDANWKGEWFYTPAQRSQYYEHGKKILKEFYQLNQKNGWTRPIDLETGFQFSISSFIIKGKIDRIDKNSDGTIILIDYKTGNVKDKLTFDEKQQLFLYQWAAGKVPELNRYGKVSQLAFHYLEDGSKQEFIGSEKDLEKMAEKIVTAAEEISLGKFAPNPSEYNCSHCDFREICDFRV